jgi:DNA polymerase elongation subunit (family B)
MIVDVQVRTEQIETENTRGMRERIKDLRISYFDKNGEIAYKELPLQQKDAFTWGYARGTDKPEPGIMSWNLRAVRKERSLRLNRYRIEEIFYDRAKELEEVFEFNVPKKYIIDIETEVTDGFPDPEFALNKVTAISIVNCTDKAVTVLALKELTAAEQDAIGRDVNEHFKKFNDKWVFRYFKFDSEYDMLYTFFAKFIHKMPCITGWNIRGFDWPYLVNRCERLKIDPAISSVSNTLIGKDKLPQHRLIVDYLEIVKKWDRVIKIKENYKLDHIGEQATGIGKIKYNGSFKDLYEQDYNKFIFYNAVDSVLVYYIDKKLNTLTTLFKLAEVDRVEVNRVFSPVSVQEALMGREFYKRGKIFVEEERNQEQKHFEGAYVKEPVIGFHNWVACYDFASLYPNTMMQFNISPEAYKGKSLDGKPKEGEIITANNNIFDATQDSVLRTILQDLYSKRKATKKKMLDINKEIAKLEEYIK